jgi:hypothetical protein
MNERRAADREKMAAILAEVVRAAGGIAVVEPCGYEPRRVDVHITCPGGAKVKVDFAGRSPQPGVYVYCWNISRDSDSRFSDEWGPGVVNEFHHAKAQRVARGFEALCQQIEADVRLCVSGRGYSRERAEAVARVNQWEKGVAEWKARKGLKGGA